jgi:hypothetical protein
MWYLSSYHREIELYKILLMLIAVGCKIDFVDDYSCSLLYNCLFGDYMWA